MLLLPQCLTPHHQGGELVVKDLGPNMSNDDENHLAISGSSHTHTSALKWPSPPYLNTGIHSAHTSTLTLPSSTRLPQLLIYPQRWIVSPGRWPSKAIRWSNLVPGAKWGSSLGAPVVRPASSPQLEPSPECGASQPSEEFRGHGHAGHGGVSPAPVDGGVGGEFLNGGTWSLDSGVGC